MNLWLGDGNPGNPLTDLQFHWGSAYMISHPENGLWVAQRRDGGGELRDAQPEGLLGKIRVDYIACPVPRRRRPSRAR